MIKIIVADDETITRKGLLKHIPWIDLGVDVVKEARDGFEALEIAKQLKPDILISDIRMPSMNGIELATSLRDILPDCKIIFLSGYTDKEYLKSAIHLKVISYVEKPIDKNKIIEAIKAAVSMCIEEESKKAKEAKVSKSITESMSFIKQKIVTGLITNKCDIKSIQNDIDVAGIQIGLSEQCSVVIFRIDPVEDYSNADISLLNTEFFKVIENNLKSIINITAFKDDRHIVSIISRNKTMESISVSCMLENIKSDFIRLFGNAANIFIAVGKDAYGYAEIYESYQTAVTALQKLFFKGYNNIVYHQEKTLEVFTFNENLEKAFLDYLDEQNKEEAVLFLENLCKDIRRCDSTLVNHVKNLFYKLSLLLLNEAEKRGIKNDSVDEQENYLWNLISGFKTIDEIRDYIIDKTLFYVTRVKEMEAVNRNIFEVKIYIQKSYYIQSLTTQKIAESVYLTPTYLCTLFKKETGKTINEYITDIRIEKSKELLSDRTVKLYEIAKKVGYNDTNYYSKTFRKLVGMTPSEFRAKFSS